MLASLIFAASAAHFLPHEEKSFVAYMRTHNLLYTGSEYQLRLGIYLANARWVREFNQAGRSFTVALNHLAILTPAEYTSLLGSTPRHQSRPATAKRTRVAEAPDSWDWRTEGIIQVIKDQGQCGSCWAFAAIAAAESAVAIKTGTLYSLSEQNLVDCVTEDEGCGGGLASEGYDYVIASQSGHFNTEAQYPYTATDGICVYDASAGTGTIISYIRVTAGSETELLDDVYNDGPAAVSIDASHNSFQLYSGGVYDEPSCSNSWHDHGVCVVGYGADGLQAYWIVKNSWGAAWGEQGYIRMSRNKNDQCAIALNAVVPVAEGRCRDKR
jgi:cathepsin L